MNTIQWKHDRQVYTDTYDFDLQKGSRFYIKPANMSIKFHLEVFHVDKFGIHYCNVLSADEVGNMMWHGRV